MTTLHIVRHGETEENVSHILQGHLPGHLTEQGKAQAHQLGITLRDIPFDHVYCSDLQRCKDTATIALTGTDYHIVYEPLLRERNWGSITGINVLLGRIAEADFPADVESVEAMFQRATQFLNRMYEQHPGAHILILTHGLFGRVLIACYHGVTIRDIARMANTEVRTLTLSHPVGSPTSNPVCPEESADN